MVGRPKRTKLPEIVEAATRVFARTSYRNTQMADIAREMGVAPGTLYLYVESKEALFDLVVRHSVAANVEPPQPASLPVKTPRANATIDYLRGVLEREGQWPVLAAAIDRARVDDPAAELEAIVVELAELMRDHQWGLLVLARSALDWPEMTLLFLGELRRRLLADLTRYVARRMASGQLRPVRDSAYAAAFIHEAIATWMLLRHNDPVYGSLSEDIVRATLVDALVHAFVKGA